jgi:hypothetical protein
MPASAALNRGFKSSHIQSAALGDHPLASAAARTAAAFSGHDRSVKSGNWKASAIAFPFVMQAIDLIARIAAGPTSVAGE